MIIRPYRPGDEVGVAAIWARALPEDPMSAGRLQARILADPAFERPALLIAEADDGGPVGFLWAAARPPTGWLVALAVDASYRR